MSRRNVKGEGDVLVLIIFSLVLAALFGLVLGGARTVSNWKCNRYSDQTERPVKFDWLMGKCYVQTKSGWRARDEQRTLDE